MNADMMNAIQSTRLPGTIVKDTDAHTGYPNQSTAVPKGRREHTAWSTRVSRTAATGKVAIGNAVKNTAVYVRSVPIGAARKRRAGSIVRITRVRRMRAMISSLTGAIIVKNTDACSNLNPAGVTWKDPKTTIAKSTRARRQSAKRPGRVVEDTVKNTGARLKQKGIVIAATYERTDPNTATGIRVRIPNVAHSLTLTEHAAGSTAA